jgi:hypothetical protein
MKLICFLNLICELKWAVVIKCCKNLKMQNEDFHDIVLSQYMCFISEKSRRVKCDRYLGCLEIKYSTKNLVLKLGGMNDA